MNPQNKNLLGTLKNYKNIDYGIKIKKNIFQKRIE